MAAKKKVMGFSAQVYMVNAIQALIAIFWSFDSRVNDVDDQGNSQKRPWTPQEMKLVVETEGLLRQVRKQAYRTCWDHRAYCRYRGEDGVCVFTVEEIHQDRSILQGCRWRGKSF